jgi:1-acyl-sn-glycerol-3-phosphate acyltransferase
MKVTFSIAWRSTLLWTVVGLGALFYNVIAIPLFLVPVKIRHKIIGSWAYIFTCMCKRVCGVTYTIKGLDNLVSGSAIIASNHQSTWETIAFVTIFPQHVWILKRELLKIPLFGWAIATLSPIAIDRSQGSASIQQILSQSVERIKHGFWILAFPEGTRVAPGIKKPYKIGVARMAESLQIPIIPVAHNAGYRLARASFWLFPGEIKVIIDKPIYPQKNETAEELNLRIEHVITKNLATITH